MAFIGIHVPKLIAESLSSIPVPGNKVKTDMMHITMAIVGKNLPIDQIVKVITACYTLCESTKPFNVGIAYRTSFQDHGSGFPIIARVISPALHILHENLKEKLEIFGIKYSKKFPEYKPHVTLSYSSSQPPDLEVKPMVWTVSSISVWGGDEGDEKIATKIDLMG